MAPSLLLMCKLLALAILFTGHYRILPEPFLPFLPWLDELDPEIFRNTLQIGVVASSLLLIFNVRPRLTAFLLGGLMLLAVLSSKAYYGNNKTFVGLLLVLAALSDPEKPAYLVRWQLSLVYFGAALNKLLDADWRSGLFFDYWGYVKVQEPIFRSVRDALPPLVAGQILCWLTIVAEFFVAFALLLPRGVAWGLWINALFQIGLLMFTGGTFTLFFYAMNAAALAFIAWPERVRVESSRVACAPAETLGEPGTQVWSETTQTGRLSVRDGSGVFVGVFAFCRLLIWSPLFWMAACTALALLPGPASVARRILVGSIFLVTIAGLWRSCAREGIAAD